MPFVRSRRPRPRGTASPRAPWRRISGKKGNEEPHRPRAVRLLRLTAAIESSSGRRTEKTIVNGSHHPLRRPTIHIPRARHRETKKFPKATYAPGDDGIQGESQSEAIARKKKLIQFRSTEFQKNQKRLVDKPLV